MKESVNTIKAEGQQFFPEKLKNVTKDQIALPTWSIIAFLVVTFIVLKSFIYITDEKRKEK